MWSIDNRTDYAADRSWIRDINGAEVWIVAVKVTYDIRPIGYVQVSAEQVPVFTGPVFHPGKESVRYETDLGPSKISTDILVDGHAYAQAGIPVKELVAGFEVGDIQRSFRIVGDRSWRRGIIRLSPSRPQPFYKMPLLPELTFGGDDQESKNSSGNPLGCGAFRQEGSRIPNIEPINSPFRPNSKSNAAVLLGPLPSHWPARRQYAGTYDETWQRQRSPLLPLDLDPRHWQLAVAEQQVAGRLKGGERVVLKNLTPAEFAMDGRVTFNLPKHSFVFETRFYDGTREQHRPVIHSLILEPDYPRFSLVYHSALACHPKVNLLDRTIIREKKRPLEPVVRKEEQGRPPEESA